MQTSHLIFLIIRSTQKENNRIVYGIVGRTDAAYLGLHLSGYRLPSTIVPDTRKSQEQSAEQVRITSCSYYCVSEGFDLI